MMTSTPRKLSRLTRGNLCQLRLMKPHCHAGVHHAIGDILALHPDLADWLIQAGVAEAISGGINVNTAANTAADIAADIAVALPQTPETTNT